MCTSFTTIESYKTKSDKKKKSLFINRLIDQWFVAIVIQFFLLSLEDYYGDLSKLAACFIFSDSRRDVRRPLNV